MSSQQPEALAQECADYATSLRSAANVAKLEGRAPPVSFLRAADLFERAASRITELESQLAQRFDAADMATAAAQGFRDGVASVSAGSEPVAVVGSPLYSHPSPSEGMAGRLQVYRCKIKSKKQIDKEIPREQQGWWADVAAGQKLLLRQAVQSDLDRCTLGGKRSRNPADYMCETQTNGSLVSKVALEYMIPEQNVFATSTPTAPSTPSSTAQQASAHVLHLVQDAFAEVAMAYPKAFALHKVGLADTAVRKALAAYTPQSADSVPAVSDLPPLPEPDLRDVGTKPREIKGFLKGYATEYARTAIAARAPADSVLEDAARYRFLRDGEWRDTDLEPCIRLQLNTLWDAKIDAARAAQEGGK